MFGEPQDPLSHLPDRPHPLPLIGHQLCKHDGQLGRGAGLRSVHTHTHTNTYVDQHAHTKNKHTHTHNHGRALAQRDNTHLKHPPHLPVLPRSSHHGSPDLEGVFELRNLQLLNFDSQVRLQTFHHLGNTPQNAINTHCAFQYSILSTHTHTLFL